MDHDSDIEVVTSKPGDDFIKSEPESDDDSDFENIVVDDNSDFENIVKSEPEDKIIQLPIQFDTDKIVLTDDGDVILIEPDNMQIEEKVLVPLGDGTIALPEQPQQMEVVRTRNLVLKRKGDDLDNIDLANVKIIKNNDADIRVREVVPYTGSSQAILPHNNSIKHPIQRRMEKDINSAKKNRQEL